MYYILLLLLVHVSQQSLLLKIFNNTAIYGDPVLSVDVPLDFTYSPSQKQPYSLRLVGQLSFPTPGNFSFDCKFDGATIVFFWLSDHLVCQYGAYQPGPDSTDGSDGNPLQIYTQNQKMTVRMDVYESLTDGNSFSWKVMWKINGSSPSPIPPSQLSPDIPDVEVIRENLQSNLAKGWSTWLHSNLLSLVRLPEGFKITIGLCHLPSAKCLTQTQIEGPANVRVGPHAYDHSYAQFFLGWNSVNVSVRFSGGENLVGLIDVISCPTQGKASCADYAVVFFGEMAWKRVGTFEISDGIIKCDSFGISTQMVYFSSDNPNVQLPPELEKIPHIAVLLSVPTVGFSSIPDESINTISKILTDNQVQEQKRMSIFGELAPVKEAVQAAVMWNFIFTPAEAGPILPVSRSWNFSPNPVNDDWTYVIFDWDNFFASYMSLDNREISYSNLIQVVRSKTAAGFVPNFSAGGLKSVDRTEPPIGAQVLLKIYEKYHEKWLVDLLFDDLLDWVTWFWNFRRLPPLGLICLGSNQIIGNEDGSENTMQGARYESGLDNSPMYDGEFFDKISHKMQLYDIGMSSLLASEAFSLAQLASAIGRPEYEKLMEISNSLKKLISGLWIPKLSTFSNMFGNNTFYPRISPTMFYPFLTGIPSDQQALSQVNAWLTNTSRFCVSPNWPSGVSDTCYWGLPSISADDPAFPPLGYWRGYVWGPMAQLTYWSLKQYDHIPTVSEGRKALCKQMSAMMMNQWNLNRHICENFSPHKDDKECTGSKFYHWGGLAGLIAIEEAGLWV